MGNFDVLSKGIIVGVTTVLFIVNYVVEALMLSKVATSKGKSPMLAWIPIVNYFLLRELAGKKSRWQWLLGFAVVALLGNSVVRWIGVQGFGWCSIVWYWSAFFALAEDEAGIGTGWCWLSMFILPVKWYVMYRMAEEI